MTNRNLEIFVAVAEQESMSRAARSLFVTQSSVSQAIAEIEKDYNVLLFERLSRSLYLTDVGRTFLRYARRILSQQAEMEEFLHCASTSLKMRIGATVTVGTCVISPILLQLKQSMPALNAEIKVANTHILEERLLKSELDICLVEGRISHPDLIIEKAIDDELVMICASNHPLSGRSSVLLKELCDQPFILREEGSGTRAQIEQEFQAQNLPMRIVWDCYNTEAIINGVADNHGVSIISERLVQRAAEQGRVWACPVRDASFARSFDLVYHKDKFITQPLRQLMDACKTFGDAARIRA